MDLREPKRKRVGRHIKPQPPFPILIESESGIPVGNGLWPVYAGNFTGDSVVVCDPEEMTSLYTLGFFGKGSFSRGYPSFGLSKKDIPPVIKERQWQRRKTWIDKIKNQVTSSLQSHNELNKNELKNEPDQVKKSKEQDNCEGQTNEDSCMEVDTNDNDYLNGTCTTELNLSSSTCEIDTGFEYSERNQLKESKSGNNAEPNFSDTVLVLVDSDDEDIEKVIKNPQPHLEVEEIKTAVETLTLTLEEAFFLCYALGCLQVIDMSGLPMTIKQMWQTFCKVKQDFVELYVAYHYFRAKGWIVKSGYKFGGDFLLYKQGPPFYHASYVVLVEKVNNRLDKYNETVTWTKVHGLHRLAESSGKDIITCQVMFPNNLIQEDLETPKSLYKFQVNEIFTKRWISSQEREEKDQT